ncbi:MAG TPA: four helix bundle protein [Candidatus Didemnitutus sp.]|nr:four helix bundle protein [Candidatus Didemnitutus sp.]
MTEAELKQRTKRFSLVALRLIDSIPEGRSGHIVARQLGRSATSVGANYRAACRSRSRAEMILRLSVVEEEADESAFWLELLVDHRILPPAKAAPLLDEAGQLTAIMVASRRTLSGFRKSSSGNSR